MGRDVSPNRLPAEAYETAFSDIHAPLDKRDAMVEASRCYFCHDAPCITACPTSIDIPMFIREIQADNAKGAARTIFRENILGGMCARVCPTEDLCEKACVRQESECKPVKIGQLQRYATDILMDTGEMPFERAAETGKKIAVVGAGPAGLSCAHRLAVHGHTVDILDAREKSGGLNEYGIAAYKTVDNFAQREVDYVLSIGGITIKNGVKLGSDVSLAELTEKYDAVFLALGMGAASILGLEGERAGGVMDALSKIEELRQADDLSKVEVGRRVVVIGGGMTAVDIAVQIKKLGADEVTMVYRRGPENMNASDYEVELAQTNGVSVRHWAQPAKLHVDGDELKAIEFDRTELGSDGRAKATGETFTLEADMVFKAIGQKFVANDIEGSTIELSKGRISVDDQKRTTLKGVWAGGDCVDGGEDLTVDAVEDGKIAAESIHAFLSQGE